MIKYRKNIHELNLSLSMITLFVIKIVINQPSKLDNINIDPHLYQQTETKLAIGERLLLQNLTTMDLEKIPGISTEIAKEIIRSKNKTLPSNDNISTLMEIKGIGKVKARSISKYLVSTKLSQALTDPND